MLIKEELKLIVRHMYASYKEQMIMSDMLKDVILHDSNEKFGYIPNKEELDWIVARLRLTIAEDFLAEQMSNHFLDV